MSTLNWRTGLLALFLSAAAALASAHEPKRFPMDEPPDPTGIAPVLLHRVEPVYPPAQFEARREGRAWVAFVVDRTGAPTRVRAFFGTNEEFEKAAEEAVKQWKLTPGQHEGHKVLTQMVVQFDFRLPKGD